MSSAFRATASVGSRGERFARNFCQFQSVSGVQFRLLGLQHVDLLDKLLHSGFIRRSRGKERVQSLLLVLQFFLKRKEFFVMLVGGFTYFFLLFRSQVSHEALVMAAVSILPPTAGLIKAFFW